jgi:membrane protein
MHPTEPTGPGAGPARQADPASSNAGSTDQTGWWQIVRRAVRQIKPDAVPDRAATLTYFGVLAIFPAVLVLVSLLGLVGPDSAQRFLDNVRSVAPGGVTDFLSSIIDQVQGNAGAAGAAAIVGILVALWSASGYIAAFMRAANAIFGVPEGRPFWKTIPVRVLTTVLVVVLLIVCVVIVVVTGPIADKVGTLIGVGDTLQWVWAIAKWPVLVIIVALLFSLLFGATPNVRYGRFRVLTVGGVVAVLTWLIASGLFGVYVSFSGSYNKTYGPLATVIVFLVWLWISNIAILLGLEVDSERMRDRAIRAGAPDDLEPYVRVRDTRKMDERDRERVDAAAAVLAAAPAGAGSDGEPAAADGAVDAGDGRSGDQPDEKSADPAY